MCIRDSSDAGAAADGLHRLPGVADVPQGGGGEDVHFLLPQVFQQGPEIQQPGGKGCGYHEGGNNGRYQQGPVHSPSRPGLGPFARRQGLGQHILVHVLELSLIHI